MTDGREHWRQAVGLGARLGLIAPEAAARALQQVEAAAEPDGVTAVQVAEWAGVDPRPIEHLAGVVDLGARTGGAIALAERKGLLSLGEGWHGPLGLPDGRQDTDRPAAAGCPTTTHPS